MRFALVEGPGLSYRFPFPASVADDLAQHVCSCAALVARHLHWLGAPQTLGLKKESGSFRCMNVKESQSVYGSKGPPEAGSTLLLKQGHLEPVGLDHIWTTDISPWTETP